MSLLSQKIRGKEGKMDLGIAFPHLEQPATRVEKKKRWIIKNDFK